MPLDNTPAPYVDPEDGGVTWAAVGHAGTVLSVKRLPDTTLVIGTFNQRDEVSQFYAMHLSQEATMNLIGFILDGRAGKAN